jgi:hypothetical protein
MIQTAASPGFPRHFSSSAMMRKYLNRARSKP